jgi:hypothetical protein
MSGNAPPRCLVAGLLTGLRSRRYGPRGVPGLGLTGSMSAMTPHIQRRGRVLRCVISTAEHGSALSGEAVREATGALRDPGPQVGAVLLAGEGPNFCTGGDVRAFAAADDPGALVWPGPGNSTPSSGPSPVPVIAVAHGWAAGAGLSIADRGQRLRYRRPRGRSGLYPAPPAALPRRASRASGLTLQGVT